MTKTGPLADPFILRNGPEYLHVLTGAVRDLKRFQESMRQLVDLELERLQKDAVRVKKAKPPKGAVKFDAAANRDLGDFDDNTLGPVS